MTHSVFGHGVSNTTAVVSAVGTTPTVVSFVGTTISTHDVSAMETSISIYSGGRSSSTTTVSGFSSVISGPLFLAVVLVDFHLLLL